MDPFAVGLLCLLALGGLICLHVPVAFAMIAVGVGGFALQTGAAAGMSVLGSELLSQLSNIDLATVPLFIMVGTFATAAGFSADIYRFAAAILGHRPGGLGYTTVLGSAAFGSICGSSPATAATFVRVGLPEMEARGYSAEFSLSTIAAGGTLKALIPPSLAMILYSIAAKVFIFEVFAAALVPAALTIAFNLLAIRWVVRRQPHLAPAGPRTGGPELGRATLQVIPAAILLTCVFAGLYSGIFTVNEAASFAAVLSALAMLLRRRMSWASVREGLQISGATTGMIYGILIGAALFGYPINLARLPETLAGWITAIPVAPVLLILLILMFYIALGAVFDEMAAMLITLPFVLPIVVQLGYDPVWWGVMNVIIIELGLIVPPVGFIVLMLGGMVPRVGLRGLYRAMWPFILANLAVLLLLLAAPWIALALPRLIYG